MPDPRAPRRARLLLWAWAIASLLSLAYVAMLFLASVPAADANDAAVGLDPRTRLLVLPVDDAARDVVPALDPNASRVLGARGDVVAFTPDANGTPRALAPFTPGPREFARAIAFAEPTMNASSGNVTWNVTGASAVNGTHVNLTGVPVLNESTGRVDAVNATVDLTAFPPMAGFLVKRDADGVDALRLVPATAVTSKIERAVLSVALWGALVFSVLGTAFPLVAIILTHKARGARGLPRNAHPQGACGECKSPLDASLAFCPRCGAES